MTRKINHRKQVSMSIYDDMIRKFNNFELGNITSKDVDRPLDNKKCTLFSGEESRNAYATTTIAWDMLDSNNVY